MTLAEQVLTRAGNLLLGSSRHGSWTEVWLRADATALAEELHAEHGDALVLHVGCLRYPFDRSEAWSALSTPVSTVELSGLRAEVLLDRDVTPTGQDVTGRVRLTSDRQIRFETGAWMPGHLLVDGAVVAAAGISFMESYAVGVEVGPRSHQDLPFAAGSAALDPKTGPSLEPSTYDLVVEVSARTGNADGIWVTRPVPVRLGDPDPTIVHRPVTRHRRELREDRRQVARPSGR